MLFSGREYDDAYISVEVAGVFSDTRVYRESLKPTVFVGAFTILIRMVEGNVTEVSWDESDCSECSIDNCVGTHNCGIAISDANNCATDSDCNLSVCCA